MARRRSWNTRFAAALALAAALAPVRVRAQATALPTPRAIEVEGAEAYGAERVRRLLRLRAGEPLRLPPERLAELLAERYHDDGYPGARVAAAYDEAEARLVLRVDEGRLGSVHLPQLGPAAEARARAALGLEPGRVLRTSEIKDALARLEEQSDGALLTGTYNFGVTPDDAGARRLELRPELRRAAVLPRLRGPHSAGFYNRVDGWNLGAGVELRLADLVRYEHTHVSLAAAYGLAAETLRYAAGVQRPVAGRLTLGYELHDLTDRDDAHRLVGLEEGPGTPVLEKSLSDFHRRRGHEAFAFLRLSRATQVGVSFRADRYEPLAVATDGDPFGGGQPRPNPPADPGAMRSVLVTLRLTNARFLFGDPAALRRSYLLRSLWGTLDEPPGGWRLEATLERTAGGDFDFTRLTASLRGRHQPLPRLRLDTRALLGVGDEAAPRQRGLRLGGEGTLRGYAQDSFAGERLAATTAELSLAPLALAPRLVGFYDGGATWSEPRGDSGWKSALGAGLRWPPDGGAFVRLDAARALGDDRERRWRWYWRLQLPL